MARKSLPNGVPIKSGGGITNFLPAMNSQGTYFVNVFNCREYPCDVVLDRTDISSVNVMSFTGFLKEVLHVPYRAELEIIKTEHADYNNCDCRAIAQIYPVDLRMPENMLQGNSFVVLPFPDQNYYMIQFIENHGNDISLTIDIDTYVGGDLVGTYSEELYFKDLCNYVLYVDDQEYVEMSINNNTPFDVLYSQYNFRDLPVDRETGGITHIDD